MQTTATTAQQNQVNVYEIKLEAYHSSFMVNTSHVNPLIKTNTGWLLWVIFITEQLQLIDPTFMYSLEKRKNICCIRQKSNAIGE